MSRGFSERQRVDMVIFLNVGYLRPQSRYRWSRRFATRFASSSVHRFFGVWLRSKDASTCPAAG